MNVYISGDSRRLGIGAFSTVVAAACIVHTLSLVRKRHDFQLSAFVASVWSLRMILISTSYAADPAMAAIQALAVFCAGAAFALATRPSISLDRWRRSLRCRTKTPQVLA